MRFLLREVVSSLMGSLGTVPFCLHMIVYNSLPFPFMILMGIGIVLTVRKGTELPKSAKRAKMMITWCIEFTLILAMINSLLMYQIQIPIVSLFPSHYEVLKLSLPFDSAVNLVDN